MPLHPAPTIDADLILVTQPLRHSAISHVAQVTFACENQASQTAQQCADAIQAAWNTNVGPLMDTNVTNEKPIILLGDGTNVPAQAIGSGATTAGESTGAMPPPQVSVLVRKRTGFGGRTNRGRMYIPFTFPEALIDEAGQLDPTTLAGHQAIYDAFLADLLSSDVRMTMANKVLVVTPPETRPHVVAIHDGNLVTSLQVEPVVATQRRRLVRS